MERETFGISRKLLEDKEHRYLLEKYLSKSTPRLVVLLDVQEDGYMINITSYISRSYKPLDMTKFPKPDTLGWERAFRILKELVASQDVVWFATPTEALSYLRESP